MWESHRRELARIQGASARSVDVAERKTSDWPCDKQRSSRRHLHGLQGFSFRTRGSSAEKKVGAEWRDWSTGSRKRPLCTSHQTARGFAVEAALQHAGFLRDVAKLRETVCGCEQLLADKSREHATTRQTCSCRVEPRTQRRASWLSVPWCTHGSARKSPSNQKAIVWAPLATSYTVSSTRGAHSFLLLAAGGGA